MNEENVYCPLTGKRMYQNRGRAHNALKHLARDQKGQGLHPYHCNKGHWCCHYWHLGRYFTRPTKAWSG
jgi:hypothetical protein